jgi:hypothetical protein
VPLCARKDVSKFDMPGYLQSSWDIDDEDLISQKGREGNESILRGGSDTGIMLLSDLGIEANKVRDRTDKDPFGDDLRSPIGRALLREELPVVLEELGEVGALVVFALEGGQPEACEGIEGLLPIML